MQKELDTAGAFLLGVIAFKKDKKAIPAHDKRLTKLIAESGCIAIGSSTPLIIAWLKGWHSCNVLIEEEQHE